MDFGDALSLIVILIGVVMLIVARVLMHKGMWDLRNDDLPGRRRGFESPYDVSDMGVMLICGGIVSAVGFNFGLKAGAWTLAAVGAALLAFNLAVRLRRADKDDKDEYGTAVVAVIISACALALGLFTAYIA